MRPTIVVLCGSMNPPHYQHLRMLELARGYVHEVMPECDFKMGIISPVNDKYGKKGLLSGTHRANMVELAIQENPHIKVSRWESEQAEWQTTRQVLEHIHEEYMGEYGKDLRTVLLCGSDLATTFQVPNLWADEDLTFFCSPKCGILMMSRVVNGKAQKVPLHPILEAHRESGFWEMKGVVVSSISSSFIRRSVASNLSVKYLLPDAVIDYIKQHKLYSS